MPIEIRELVIKATVTPDSDTASGNADTGNASDNNVSASAEIINICVEKILEILKEKNER
jgi:hypothetical protein